MRSKVPNHGSEKRFAYLVAGNGKDYVYQPRWFRFSNGEKYLPDFYCVQTKTYIEVVGCHSTFKQNTHKYLLMEKEFAKTKMIYVWVWNDEVEKYRLDIDKPAHMPYKERYGIGLEKIAGKLGVSTACAYRLLNEKETRHSTLLKLGITEKIN